MKYLDYFMTIISITFIILGVYTDNYTAMISGGVATGIWLASVLNDIFEDFDDLD